MLIWHGDQINAAVLAIRCPSERDVVAYAVEAFCDEALELVGHEGAQTVRVLLKNA
jgi:hypothetical protein